MSERSDTHQVAAINACDRSSRIRLARDEVRLICHNNGGALPLPLWERGGVSDYLKSQVALAYWARASRAFALRRTSSFRASAMRMTIFSFPAATNLSRNSPRLLS